MSNVTTYELPPLPDQVTQVTPDAYIPAPAWSSWIFWTLIAADGRLCNEDHAHLRGASTEIVMTNEANTRKGRRILGRAALGDPSGSDAWTKGQRKQQIERWFGDVPDFLLILDGLWIHDRALEGDAAAILALLEHELYHCSQEQDEFGMPRFSRATGKPVWATRSHDVEEFVGVVRRYGAGAPADATAQLVEAAASEPEVAPAKLDGLCGTCGQELT